MTFRLDRNVLHTDDAHYLDVQIDRRTRNRAAGNSINENSGGTHGKAMHGCRCRACYAVHAGVPIENVPLVYQRRNRWHVIAPTV